MKIAVESNDGINIASPYNLLKNFMVFEIEETSTPMNCETLGAMLNNRQLKPIKNISKANQMLTELCECSTIITHNLSKPLLNKLQGSGVDVFITYQNRINDALNQYLKDRMIHEFHQRN